MSLLNQMGRKFAYPLFVAQITC